MATVTSLWAEKNGNSIDSTSENTAFDLIADVRGENDTIVFFIESDNSFTFNDGTKRIEKSYDGNDGEVQTSTKIMGKGDLDVKAYAKKSNTTIKNTRLSIT